MKEQLPLLKQIAKIPASTGIFIIFHLQPWRLSPGIKLSYLLFHWPKVAWPFCPHLPYYQGYFLGRRVICRWLLPVLGLEVLVSANWSRLPLLVGLGPLKKEVQVCQGQLVFLWKILEKSTSWAKRGCLYGKVTRNGLGGSQKLGGSQGITRVGLKQR